VSFTTEDLDRVLDAQLEVGVGDPGRSLEWLAAREIDVEVMHELLEGAVRGFSRGIAATGDPRGSIIDVAGQMFRLGWEAALSTRETLRVD
jgi:hypothetical protein